MSNSTKPAPCHCRTCHQCTHREDNYCSKQVQTYNAKNWRHGDEVTYGGTLPWIFHQRSVSHMVNASSRQGHLEWEIQSRQLCISPCRLLHQLRPLQHACYQDPSQPGHERHCTPAVRRHHHLLPPQVLQPGQAGYEAGGRRFGWPW